MDDNVTIYFYLEVCGVGCCMIQRDDILQERNVEDILDVEVQFSDKGDQQDIDHYMSDRFQVRRWKWNLHAPPSITVIAEFNVTYWDYYSQGLRAGVITNAVIQWLRYSGDREFFFKFRKVGDTNDTRFEYRAQSAPSLILKSHQELVQPPIRIRRQEEEPTLPCPDDNDEANKCCLRNRTLSSGDRAEVLLYLELDDDFYVTTCVGHCSKSYTFVII